MFTEPKVSLTTDLNKRGYVTYHYNGVRYREYNGKKLRMDINPNYYKSYNDRLRLLTKLRNEFSKALTKGWNPEKVKDEDPIKIPTIHNALHAILEMKLNSDLSLTYKNDLTRLLQKFICFIPSTELNKPINEINSKHVEDFLNQFSSSGVYYMNKRRALNVFFSELLRTKLIADNPVQNSLRRKQKSVLHKIYTKEQLIKVLDYLKPNYPNLHLCCLLAYGCFLRPHQEARLLCFKHINVECTKITLSGNENKSKRIRVVNIPDFVKSELQARLELCNDVNLNIMSKSFKPFNVSYLNTQWSSGDFGETDHPISV